MIGENFIDRLPQEILLKVFKYIDEDDKQSTLNAMLVCQRWKILIETFHVFELSRFFATKRNDEEYSLALNSNRQYRKFKVTLENQNDLEIKWIENIFHHYGNTIKEVDIDIGQSEGFSFEYIYKLLAVFKDMEHISIICKELHESDEVEKPEIVFEKLKTLKIDWTNIYNITINRFILNYMKAPILKELQIILPYGYDSDEKIELFKYLSKYPSNLHKVYIWSSNNFGFDWTPEYLEIWCQLEVLSEMKEFLVDRKASLKTFKVHWMGDSDFVSQIFEAAKNLEHFETSEDISIYCTKQCYKNIKMLTLWNFWYEENFVASLLQTFPDIEVMRFAYSDLAAETLSYIRRIFTKLKEIRLYNSTTNCYELVEN